MRVRLTAAVVLALAGCGEASTSHDDAAEEEPEELPTPTFVDPAQGALSLIVTRTKELSLQVGGISPGHTTLRVDGRDVGTLSTRTSIGRLDVQRLTLNMGGAMVPGRHTLQLVSPGLDEPKASDPVTVDLDPDTALARPVVTASQPSGFGGDVLVAAGSDEAGVLVLFEDDRAHVLPASGSGWALSAASTLVLPGLERMPNDRCPPSVLRIADEAGDRLRVAWRVGLPGTRVDVLEIPVQADAAAEIVTALELDPELVGIVEYAALDCPRLSPRVVLAELLAMVDSEQPRPGDRAVLSATFLGDRLEPGLPRRLVLSEPIDLDLLEPIIDLTTPAGVGPTLIGARMGELWPVVIEVDAGSGTATRRLGSEHPIAALATIDRPLRVVTGAFGSRTVAGLDHAAGQLVVARIDDSSRRVPTVFVIDELDGVPAGAAPAAGLVGGTPLFVVPMGDDRPVVAVTMRASQPAVRPLDLHCDAVALPRTRAANEGTEIGLACLRSEALHLVTLALD